MREAIRRHPFAAFYVLAVSIASAVILYWMVAAVIYERVEGEPLDLFALVVGTQVSLGYDYLNLVSTLHIMAVYPLILPALFFGLSPTLSALIVTALNDGRAGLARLLARLKPAGRGRRWKDVWWVYGIIVLVSFLLYPLFLWVEAEWGAPGWYEKSRRIIGLDTVYGLIPAFLIGAFLDEGGTLEELGWRGFALPYLLERFSSPLKAALILGALWAAWHLPRDVPFLLSGEVPFFDFLIGQISFFASGIAVTVIIVCFFNLAGGSVIPAIMIHGLTNFFSKAFDGMPVYALGFEFQDLVELLLMLVVLLIFGRRLGYTRRD